MTLHAPTLLRPYPPDQKELHAFLSRHLELLARERQAEIDQTSLLASNCSQKELETRGLSVGSLGVSSVSIGLGGKTLVEVYRPSAYHDSPLLPPHDFRTGDPVRLEPHVSDGGSKKSKRSSKDDPEDLGIEGVVARINREKITLAFDSSTDNISELPDRLRIIKLANSATFDRMETTLRHMAKIILDAGFPSDGAPRSNPPPHNEELLRVLFALRQPEWLSLDTLPSATTGELVEAQNHEPISFFDSTLNDSQKEAVKFAVTARDVACIHGPPGTGKTFTLVEIIRQLVFVHKKRVLVCGASNLAVDNLLARLSPIFPHGALLRLGHPARISANLVSRTLDYQTTNSEDADIVKDVKEELEGTMKSLTAKKGDKGFIKAKKDRWAKWQDVKELRKEYRQREAKVVKNVVGGAQVVLSTCHGAGSRQINNMTFDVCIIDEATQAVEAVCWIPILKSKTLILAGDPLQLPPTILSDEKRDSKITLKVKPLRFDGLDDGSDEAKVTCATTTSTTTSASEAASEADTNEEELRDGLSGIGIDGATSTRTRLRPPRTLETTLFDRLERVYGSGVKRMLTVQYRMHESIAEFPSTALYHSALISAPLVARRKLFELPSTVDPESEDTQEVLGHSVVFFDTAGCEMYERSEAEDSNAATKSNSLGEGSRFNENEAEIVSKWVRQLIDLGVPTSEIAVITPYQAQVAHIAGLLREDYPDLIVGSVDGMQGQEREAVVLSLVRSNPTKEVGFLAERRRLNVAMTRAKRQLCVVGDSSTVSQGSGYLKSWMSWLEENADVRWPGD